MQQIILIFDVVSYCKVKDENEIPLLLHPFSQEPKKKCKRKKKQKRKRMRKNKDEIKNATKNEDA